MSAVARSRNYGVHNAHATVVAACTYKTREIPQILKTQQINIFEPKQRSVFSFSISWFCFASVILRPCTLQFRHFTARTQRQPQQRLRHAHTERIKFYKSSQCNDAIVSNAIAACTYKTHDRLQFIKRNRETISNRQLVMSAIGATR